MKVMADQHDASAPLARPRRRVVERLRSRNVGPQGILESPRDQRPRHRSAVMVHPSERVADGTHHLVGGSHSRDAQATPVLGPQREVDMLIDEPRHQPAPIEVDAFRLRIGLSVAGARRRHRHDPAVGHTHVDQFAGVRRGGVPQSGSLNHQRRCVHAHSVGPPASRDERPKARYRLEVC